MFANIASKGSEAIVLFMSQDPTTVGGLHDALTAPTVVADSFALIDKFNLPTGLGTGVVSLHEMLNYDVSPATPTGQLTPVPPRPQ